MEDSKLKVFDDLISSINSDFEIKEFVGKVQPYKE